MRRAMLLVVAVSLVSCAEQTKLTWVRADGVRPTPVLTQQFEIDRTVCEGEMQRANMSGGTQFCQGIAGCVMADIARNQSMQTVGKGCMAQKGYVQVPETEAEQKMAEFRGLHEPPPQQTAKR